MKKFNKQEYQKAYYLKNRIKLLLQRKEYVKINKVKCVKVDKKYYETHREQILAKKKKYYLKNKKSILNKITKYYRIKRSTNINFKILCNLRTRLYLVLKNNPKSSTTMKLVGCSVERLKEYLQSKFQSGMTWSNYGKWHVDHIKPCASFDLSKPSEQKKCFRYTNLQPLWAKDNLSKPKQKIK
jgi:hypothetical protein